MDFQSLAESRYSVRSFSGKPIEDEKLRIILKTAQSAPTACNNQPQRIYAVISEDALKKLGAVTRFTFGAGTVLVFTSKSAEEWRNPLTDGYHTGEIDVSIACTHAMLQAWELGIGSCWVGYFDPEKVRSALSIPSDEKIIALLPLGYPADGSKPASGHFSRKPLEDTVKFL